MRIEFYRKDNKEVIPSRVSDDYYFVMNNKVFKDNGDFYESQQETVNFDHFVVECPGIGWRPACG